MAVAKRMATALVVAGCAAVAVPVVALGSGRPASPAGPRAAVTGPPAPAAHDQGRTRAAATAGACPGGGLDWTAGPSTVIVVDPGLQEWLVQERGTVTDRSPAAIIVGNGVALIGRTAAWGAPLPVLDLPLTPLGSLILGPGQTEPYSGAIMVQSTTAPVDLGLGLSTASWEAPALVSQCAPPAGAAPASGQPATSRLA